MLSANSDAQSDPPPPPSLLGRPSPLAPRQLLDVGGSETELVKLIAFQLSGMLNGGGRRRRLSHNSRFRSTEMWKNIPDEFHE